MSVEDDLSPVVVPEPRVTETALRVVPAEIPVPSIFTGRRRYQIRFPDRDSFFAAQASEAPTTFRTPVALSGRGVLAVEVPTALAGPVTAFRNEASTIDFFAREYGAVVMEDYQYAMDSTGVFEVTSFLAEEEALATLDDVTQAIAADRCWKDNDGSNVVIAVVDTGVDGSHPEFAPAKRAGSWEEPGQSPWTDWKGHGTMCAAIAAGTTAYGGRHNGVAPGARLIACKTQFYDSQLAAVYDYLSGLRETENWTIVATNSYGIPVGASPPPPGSVFMEALDDAIKAGVNVVFSAGNYHALAMGKPEACWPTSIWQYKCRADVLTVGTCRLDRKMWYYSSRGPGDIADEPNMRKKPDVTAPTPENGAILYGDGTRVLSEGWGTSGAAPQAAGLAALLLSRKPELSAQQIFDIIRDTAVPLGHGAECEGYGLIDCRGALDRV
jgi:serine protease AprX